MTACSVWDYWNKFSFFPIDKRSTHQLIKHIKFSLIVFYKIVYIYIYIYTYIYIYIWIFTTFIIPGKEAYFETMGLFIMSFPPCFPPCFPPSPLYLDLKENNQDKKSKRKWILHKNKNKHKNQASRDVREMIQKNSKKYQLEENQVRRNISVYIVTKTY